MYSFIMNCSTGPSEARWAGGRVSVTSTLHVYFRCGGGEELKSGIGILDTIRNEKYGDIHGDSLI